MAFSFPYAQVFPGQGGGGDGNATEIQGIPVDAGPPAVGDTFVYDGTEWTYTPLLSAGTFVTVGATGGAQYATYYDALTAGKFFIFQISNTTETQQYTFTGTNKSLFVVGANSVSADFGNFNLRSSTGVRISLYARNVIFVFNAPSNACFYFGLGSNFVFENCFLNAATSVRYTNTNGGSSVSGITLINTSYTLKGATNGFTGMTNFYQLGGTITCQASATACIPTASNVYFAPSFITGSILAGKNEFIRASYLTINNVVNQTTASGVPGTDAMVMRATINLNMTNYYDYNFNSFPTDFRVDANGNGFLNNVKITGQFALQNNTAITIEGSVLDSFTDAAGSGGATITCSDTQWIASSGTFTFNNTGASVKNYRFNNCNFANSVVVANDKTQLTNIKVSVGDFTISNNVSNVKVTNIDVANDIFINGNYCSISQFTCNSATFSNNALSSSLTHSTLLSGGITINAGCAECAVINTSATIALVDNGTNSKLGFNTP